MRMMMLMLAGCSADKGNDSGAGGSVSAAADFSVPGPYVAGTLDDELVGGTGETLTVQVWFPSNDVGEETVSYDNVYVGEAFTDVAPACDSPRNVLLFSHGYGGIRWQSPFLGDALASHGWLVVAPDHAANTFFDNDDSRIDELVVRRPADLADAFDWLVEQSDDPSSPLAGCVDAVAGYAVSGHSFGGYTAYAAGGALIEDPATAASLDVSDPRVWAVMTWAPWNASGVLSDGTSAINVPVMTLGGELDATTPPDMVRALHAAVTATPRYLGMHATAGHNSYAPIACDLGIEADNGCGAENVDLDAFTHDVGVASLAFLESTLGVPGSIEQLPTTDPDISWEIVE
jgi:predicted dienelactone hydrolase